MKRASVTASNALAFALVVASVAMLAAGCLDDDPGIVPAAADAGGEVATSGDANVNIPKGDPVDTPIDGVTREQLAIFTEGDDLFGLALREPDGLGPLYTRLACSSCHEEGLRGPGLVQKMSVMLADGITPAPDQSKLAYGHTVHPLLSAGATTPIVPPPDDPSVKISVRVGPPVIGRGYMEAVLDSEIERVAAEQAARSDVIHGRINRVIYASESSADETFHTLKKGDSAIGRFGLKARIATLDDFVADALQGDMGITSPLRPNEFPNPDALTDDLKPGIDVGLHAVNLRTNYIRLIAIPKRLPASPQAIALFAEARCNVCHVPSMKTRADYPIPQLAGIEAPVFTDFLLHDMGDALADGLPEGVDENARSRDWRTAPLIGLRFNKTFLHDSRAHTIEEAILGHDGNGSEAHEAVERFKSLVPADRAMLLEYVEGL